eukprot:gene7884-5509_t
MTGGGKRFRSPLRSTVDCGPPPPPPLPPPGTAGGGDATAKLRYLCETIEGPSINMAELRQLVTAGADVMALMQMPRRNGLRVVPILQFFIDQGFLEAATMCLRESPCHFYDFSYASSASGATVLHSMVERHPYYDHRDEEHGALVRAFVDRLQSHPQDVVDWMALASKRDFLSLAAQNQLLHVVWPEVREISYFASSSTGGTTTAAAKRFVLSSTVWAADLNRLPPEDRQRFSTRVMANFHNCCPHTARLWVLMAKPWGKAHVAAMRECVRNGADLQVRAPQRDTETLLSFSLGKRPAVVVKALLETSNPIDFSSFKDSIPEASRERIVLDGVIDASYWEALSPQDQDLFYLPHGVACIRKTTTTTTTTTTTNKQTNKRKEKEERKKGGRWAETLLATGCAHVFFIYPKPGLGTYDLPFTFEGIPKPKPYERLELRRNETTNDIGFMFMFVVLLSLSPSLLLLSSILFFVLGCPLSSSWYGPLIAVPPYCNLAEPYHAYLLPLQISSTYSTHTHTHCRSLSLSASLCFDSMAEEKMETGPRAATDALDESPTALLCALLLKKTTPTPTPTTPAALASTEACRSTRDVNDAGESSGSLCFTTEELEMLRVYVAAGADVMHTLCTPSASTTSCEMAPKRTVSKVVKHCSLLSLLAYTGETEALSICLSTCPTPIDFRIVDEDERTPLHALVNRPHLDLAALLRCVQSGADIQFTGTTVEDMRSAVESAVLLGDAEAMRVLLRTPAPVDFARCDSRGYTALHLIPVGPEKTPEMVQSLLNAVVDRLTGVWEAPGTNEEEGAAGDGSKREITWIGGAKNKYGHEPLSIAAFCGHLTPWLDVVLHQRKVPYYVEHDGPIRITQPASMADWQQLKKEDQERLQCTKSFLY